MIKRITWLLLAVLLTLPVSVLAAEPGTGTIQGQVVNSTKDGTSKVNDIEITLTTYLNGDEDKTTTARSDDQGAFTFEGVATDAAYSYQIKLAFLGADYTSDPIAFKSGETSQSVMMKVYETTPTDEAIKVSIEHTVIFPATDGLQIEKYYMFTNESDRAFIGGKEIAPDKKETLRFALPQGAVQPQYLAGLMECCVYNNSGGFVDTMAVTPGTREIAYAFKLDYGAAQRSLADQVKYPTKRYEVLVRGEGIQISSAQLTNAGPTNINGVQYQRLSGSGLNPDDAVTLQIAGLPQKESGVAPWLIPTVLVLIGATGVLYWLRRRQPQPVPARAGAGAASGTAPRSAASLAQRKQKLLMEMARLDDDFEAGRIAEEAYRRSRAQKKAELVGLMAKEK